MRRWIAAPKSARNDGCFGITKPTHHPITPMGIILRVKDANPASSKLG